MRAGDTVTWRARHFGWWFELSVQITEFDPPHRFIDEQIDGPFRRLRHVHHFLPVSEGTLMIDDFSYDLPLGWCGSLADRLFVGSYMLRLLRQRNRVLQAAAESQGRSM